MAKLSPNQGAPSDKPGKHVDEETLQIDSEETAQQTQSFSCARKVTLGSALLILLGVTGFFVATHAFGNPECVDPCVPGDESIMSNRAGVQSELRWDVDRGLADRVCNFNRHYAEPRGYYARTSFLRSLPEYDEENENPTSIQFYDSNTGKLLFEAPKGRSWKAFLDESDKHGWPSFRDEEVNWEIVRVLKYGETVSLNGTHLGHNLPDLKGNRFCINLVSVSGQPQSD